MKKDVNKKGNNCCITRFVPGRNSVLEVLKNIPEKIVKIYYASDNSDKRGLEILNLAKKFGIHLECILKHEIQKLTKVDNHQGFVAVIKDTEDHSLKSYINSLSNKQGKICVVAVDSVEDPHNLGTIFRASECLGVDAVILCKNRGVCITPTVSKVAVGATELVHYIEVSNLLTAIRDLKKLGFWCVVADVQDNSINLNEFHTPERSILIVGAEGLGVKKVLKDEADFIVKIPQVGKIDSLNVSQATAVMLYQMMCL